jgi:hypothetical protein
MIVLIGCEESQVLCSEFRGAGHEAYSCDLQPTRGNPAWHYQSDIMKVIPLKRWDLIVLFPDCTAMSVSGNRHYAKGTPGYDKRLSAVKWTKGLWELAKKYSPKVALENPGSVIFPHLRNLGATVQYIQPWQHGHGETKKTGLAIHNLPLIKPSKIVNGREQRVWKMPPSPNRKRDRSETFLGIAKAIVEQWG